MNRFFHARASYTLRDGEHRFRRLERSVHQKYPEMLQHMYRSGFNPRVENLVAVFSDEFLPGQWSKIQEKFELMRNVFTGQDFFVDRLKIEVPLLDLNGFPDQTARLLYFLVSEQIYCLKDKSSILLEICRANGLMAMEDVFPVRSVEHHDIWELVGKYELLPNGGRKARQLFDIALADLYKEGIKLGQSPRVTAVIADDDPDQDLSFIAPVSPDPSEEIPF